MRTYILLSVISALVIASACHPTRHNTTAIPPNQMTRDEEGNFDLYGKTTEAGLQQAPFNAWYTTNYNEYTPDSNILVTLRPELRGKTFQLFMATWCGDSKREVPRMLKVLAQCGVPPTSIEIINTGKYEKNYKQSPTHEERGKYIHRVPTLIMYKDGKELNRLVESPVQSIEKDLLVIARSEAYAPKYPGAAWLLQWYTHPQWEQHQQDSTRLTTELKRMVLNRSELNALGHVQLGSGEAEKAFFTLRLNTILYPEDPLALRNFSKLLLRKGDTLMARQYLEKAERYAGQ